MSLVKLYLLGTSWTEENEKEKSANYVLFVTRGRNFNQERHQARGGSHGANGSHVTLLLILLSRGPLGHLILSRASSYHANGTSGLDSVTTVKQMFLLQLVLVAIIVGSPVIPSSRGLLGY